MNNTEKVKPMTQIQKKYLKERVDDIVEYAKQKMNRIETNDDRDFKRNLLKSKCLKMGINYDRLISYVDSKLSESFDPYSVFGYSKSSTKDCTINIPLKNIYGISAEKWDDLVEKTWDSHKDIEDTLSAIKNNITHKGNFLQDDIILSFHTSYDKICDKVKSFQDWTEEQVRDYQEQVHEHNNQYKEV